jgi:alcohol dehydrogenase
MAVNTTTGTGANCTNNAVIIDVAWVYKLLIIVPGIQPTVGIDDPALMRLQPPRIIAWSSMDAFCHAMEPFIGRYNFPVCHATGYRAIKLLSENLRQAYANPANDEAIENMAWAQFIASMSFNMGGGMGMVHLVAHMVSVLKNLHHGYSNAIMMLPVERFNVTACPDRFKEIGEAMGLDIRYTNPIQAADITLEAIERLRDDVGIRQIRLRELDFTEQDIDHSVKWCLKDISGEANPRSYTGSQLKDFFRSCV